MMITARLTVVDALKAVGEQERDEAASALAGRLAARVSRGITLSDALGRERGFDQAYRQLVRVGEETGDLATVMRRLVGHLDRSLALRRQLRSVMAYPIMVVIVAMLAVGFLLAFIVPMFAMMYRDFGAQLPRPTQFLLDFSGWAVSNSLWLVSLLALLCWVGSRSVKNRSVRRVGTRWFLRVPYLGNLLRQHHLANFTATIATLLQGGIGVADALTIFARSSANPVVADDVRGLASAVTRGGEFSRAAQHSAFISPALAQLIAVGERSGTLETALSDAARHYADELEASVDTMSTLIEPAVILILGIVLGSILVALYLPIFELSSIVG